jgi:MFS family permease
MRRVAWRPVLLAICALVALVQVASVLDVIGMGGAPPWWGRLGARIDGAAGPAHVVVRSVEPGGPADRAGLRRGDLIDMRANSVVDRLATLSLEAPLNGRPLVLAVHRGSLQKEISLVPEPVPAQRYWDFLLGSLGSLWLLLFAALIAWRRADVPQMRLLSTWLTVFVLVGATTGFAAPWSWPYVLFGVLSSLALALVLALWAAFASCFAQPLSRPRRIAQWLCYVFVAISIANSGFWIAETIDPQFHPLPPTHGFGWLIAFLGALVMAVVCGVLAIAASRGVERQRAVWTILPLAAIYCYYTVFAIATSSSSSSADSDFWSIAANLVILVAPLALTYAALSRRLIDVGFFLNRAAVFTVVSTIVIGTFVLVEWAASEWFARTGRTAGTVISMGVALGLGFSMRYIHRYADRFVDRVFFRKRHEDEAALRRFAHESSYITDRSVLLQRAVREVKAHTDAADATILVQNGEAVFTSVAQTGAALTSANENDPGILALRAWHKPVDLGSLEDSVLRGEFAFPMVSRGTLVGVLICEAKRNGESYAPDESAALLALAHGVGTALDVLSAQQDRPNEVVLRELAELREDVKRMMHK